MQLNPFGDSPLTTVLFSLPHGLFAVTHLPTKPRPKNSLYRGSRSVDMHQARPHHLILFMFRSCTIGCSLWSNTPHLTLQLPVRFHHHLLAVVCVISVPTLAVLLYLLFSVVVFLSSAARTISLLLCKLDLWSVTGCYTEATDVSNW